MGGVLTRMIGRPAPASGPALFNFPPLFTGGIAGGAWDIADIATLWKDTAGTTPVTADGDLVARVDDKSGNGKNLLQATSGNRPVYKTSGGLKWLDFQSNGNNAYMQVAFTLGTTWSRVSGLNILTAFPAAAFDQPYSGVGANVGLYINAPLTGFVMFTGANGPVLTYTTGDAVWTERWANPSSIRLDNGSFVTTPSLTAVNPGGITIGANNSPSGFINMKWYGGIEINRALTGPEEAAQVTYWGAAQGRSL